MNVTDNDDAAAPDENVCPVPPEYVISIGGHMADYIKCGCDPAILAADLCHEVGCPEYRHRIKLPLQARFSDVNKVIISVGFQREDTGYVDVYDVNDRYVATLPNDDVSEPAHKLIAAYRARLTGMETGR